MSQPVVFANDDDFQRFLSGMRIAERLIRHGITSTNSESTTTNTQPTRTTVNITDQADEHGQYPAKMQYYNNDTFDSLAQWFDGDICVAVPINEGDVLVVGQRYDAQIIGENIDGKLITTVGVAGSGGFFARLTAVSGGKWKAVPQTLDIDGNYMDNGSEFASYIAVPLKGDGTNFITIPFVGMRVWMIPSKQPGFYEFLPIGKVTTGSDNGTAYSFGWLKGLQTTNCLKLVVLGATGLCNDIDITQVIQLTHSAGTWTSAGGTPSTFLYDGGSGTVVLEFINGEPYLKIGSVYLSKDGAGLSSDGVHYADFAGGVVGALCSTGTPADPCSGNIFRVRLTCTDCLITTACCAGSMPANLTATFSAGTGAVFPTIDGTSVPLTWNGTSWQGNFTMSGVGYSIGMSCVNPFGWGVGIDRTTPACGGISLTTYATGTCGVATTSLVVTRGLPAGCAIVGQTTITITG